MSGDSFKHGSSPGLSGYRRGCRCEECRTGKRLYMRGYRARRREAEAAAAGAQPLVDRVEVSEPDRPDLNSAPALDLLAPAGTIEKAFDEDLEDPAGEVLWKKSYIAMARLNARMMDQVVRHERLDLIPSLQLRQNEILNRLAYMKVNGQLGGKPRDPDAPDSKDEDVAAEQARVLAELENGGTQV